MRYFVLLEDYDETNVYISEVPDALPDSYELLQGVSQAAKWPKDLALRFSKDRKEGMNLTDWVENEYEWLIASGRFKKLLEEAGAPDVEYLRVTIKNHKGRIASADYWVVNFLVHHPAVDRDRSVFEVDAAYPSRIYSFDKLVLTNKIENEGPIIFRLAEKPRLVLVRADLAERIEKAKITGLKLKPTDRYLTFDPEEG
jgi:hypothetical protein